MKKSLILALAATSLTAGGAALAQDRPERGGDISLADIEARSAERFARMDVNGDGLLNAADREARARSRFEQADANGDGALTFEEAQAAREEHRAARTERRAEAGEARGNRGHRMGRRGGMHRGMAERADTDNDGSISEAEFATAALARFQQADTDGDGTITAEERRALRGEMREHMRERRGNRAGSAG